MDETDEKRLFFGIEVKAPWPEKLPKGRILEETQRHATLAFLGKTDFPKLLEQLDDFPRPPFQVGLVGKLDEFLFLPPRHPRVVAWNVHLLDEAAPLLEYQKEMTAWLQERDFPPANPDREWLPHVTVARSPFTVKEWKKSFRSLPAVVQDIHLYESLGGMQYHSRWRMRLDPPFEEIPHTADIAFRIRGETVQQLHSHAQVALAFQFPVLLDYFSRREVRDLDDVIIDLNRVVTQVDSDVGAPLKAVSFHGEIREQGNILEWEMVVDV